MKAWNKFCCALASMALLMGSLAAPAFAYGAETDPAPDPAPAPVTVPTAEPAEEAPVTVQEEVSGPLTPEGNLTLVDDYHTTYSDGSRLRSAVHYDGEQIRGLFLPGDRPGRGWRRNGSLYESGG